MNLITRLGSASRKQIVLMALAIPFLTWSLLLPLSIGIWLPDILCSATFATANTVASAQTPSGHRFRVTQYWGGDFYTTELIYTLPSGKVRCGLIDGDAGKWWNAEISLNEARQLVTVKGKSYHWPQEEAVILQSVPVSASAPAVVPTEVSKPQSR